MTVPVISVKLYVGFVAAFAQAYTRGSVSVTHQISDPVDTQRALPVASEARI